MEPSRGKHWGGLLKDTRLTVENRGRVLQGYLYLFLEKGNLHPSTAATTASLVVG